MSVLAKRWFGYFVRKPISVSIFWELCFNSIKEFILCPRWITLICSPFFFSPQWTTNYHFPKFEYSIDFFNFFRHFALLEVVCRQGQWQQRLQFTIWHWYHTSILNDPSQVSRNPNCSKKWNFIKCRCTALFLHWWRLCKNKTLKTERENNFNSNLILTRLTLSHARTHGEKERRGGGDHQMPFNIIWLESKTTRAHSSVCSQTWNVCEQICALRYLIVMLLAGQPSLACQTYFWLLAMNIYDMHIICIVCHLIA